MRDEFHDTRNLVQELLKNREVLTRQEEVFREVIGPLSNYRRAAVYQYVNTLKERIRLLTEKTEEIGLQLWEVTEGKTTNDKRGNDEEKTLDTDARG